MLTRHVLADREHGLAVFGVSPGAMIDPAAGAGLPKPRGELVGRESFHNPQGRERGKRKGAREERKFSPGHYNYYYFVWNAIISGPESAAGTDYLCVVHG